MAGRKSAYWLDMMMLGIEVQHAVALRLLKLSKGGVHAQRESQLMISEKIMAGMIAGSQMVNGSSPTRIVKSYRAKVRANIRRLSK